MSVEKWEFFEYIVASLVHLASLGKLHLNVVFCLLIECSLHHSNQEAEHDYLQIDLVYKCHRYDDVLHNNGRKLSFELILLPIN
jgi:hypothetical protein